MLYRIVDEAGEVCAEINISEERFTKLITQLSTSTTPDPEYTLAQTTLLQQMYLLAAQSKDNPQLSAANSEAMCIIAKALEETNHG